MVRRSVVGLSLLVTLVTLVTLATLGCESRVSIGGRCSSDTDCGDLRCTFGRCRAECARASDCADPLALCLDEGGIGEPGHGVCTVPSLDRCSTDCAAVGLVCDGELCTTPCTDTCLEGASCDSVTRVCVAVSRRDAGVREDAAEPLDAPTSVDAGTGLDASSHQLCAGYEHLCAIGSDRRVYCWGNNHANTLGDGISDHGMGCPWIAVNLDAGVSVDDCDDQRMHAVVSSEGPVEGVVSIECGRSHTCALTATHQVLCWGYSGVELGGGPTMGFETMAITTVPSGATALTVGDSHACAIVEGLPKCWGHNGTAPPDGDGPDGRLGRTDLLEASAPSEAPGLEGLSSLSAGGTLSCGVTATGGVRCVGSRSFEAAQPEGRDIVGVTHPIALSAGIQHGCALADEGLVCWGSNATREIGVGTAGLTQCGGLCRATAAPVTGSTRHTYVGLSHGASSHTCAIRSTGEVDCWGSNLYGESGTDPGPTFSEDVVASIGTPIVRSDDGTSLRGVVEVAVGGDSCARTEAGEIWCWGFDNYGQLGFYETGDPGDQRLSQPYPQAHLVGRLP